MHILIIGGVAAGASCAARARRLSETASITIVERGPDVSFANCGLPYHIGGEIASRDALKLHTPKSLSAMLGVEVLTQTEAVEIDRANRRVAVRPTGGGNVSWLGYDKLLLAPGASPMRPPLPGIDNPRIHTLRNLADMDAIKAASLGARRVVVIGAGFIGLEMCEQLRRLGMEVALVELQDQILPQMDADMTVQLRRELIGNGIAMHLGKGIEGFEEKGGWVECLLAGGARLEADLVVLSIGVRPEKHLAAKAGLKLGKRGHIVVDGFLRTSDPDIYAAGDVVRAWTGSQAGRSRSRLAARPTGRVGRRPRTCSPRTGQTASGLVGTAIVRASALPAA
jgi:NADPH-dependent 2,4-dienoyl-CoA reductase/sulfur reductase-like enzyme